MYEYTAYAYMYILHEDDTITTNGTLTIAHEITFYLRVMQIETVSQEPFFFHLHRYTSEVIMPTQ